MSPVHAASFRGWPDWINRWHLKFGWIFLKEERWFILSFSCAIKMTSPGVLDHPLKDGFFDLLEKSPKKGSSCGTTLSFICDVGI
jgi:hypothetical protein